MFGPKNTARDVAVNLIAGLKDGSIVLRPSDTESAAKPVSPLNDLLRNGADAQTNGTDRPVPSKLLTKDRR
jgi:hypothetical protein